MKVKEVTTRTKVWVKPIEQMDVWLDSQGFYRKHCARDGSCLFRAVSEQIFMTQVHHYDVRRQVVEFEMANYDYFQKMVRIPLEEHCEKVRDPREWGGRVEIEAMAMLYKYDFKVFREVSKPPELVTDLGFDRFILLCFTADKHFDSVYSKETIMTSAFCQSIVYNILYKKVFELKEVDYAVRKMLYEKPSRSPRDHVPFMSSEFALKLEMRENYRNVRDLLDHGITPFPYKVAKSLDSEMYRNVEYDAWNEYRKGLRFGFCAWSCKDLQVGVKCLVKLEGNEYHGHIQHMTPNKGPVVVYIEELGRRTEVPYNALEVLPQSSQTVIPSPQLVFPFKLPQLQLDNDDKARKILKNLAYRPRVKESSTYQKKFEETYKNCKARTRKNEETQNPTVSSTTQEPESDSFSQHYQNDQIVPDLQVENPIQISIPMEYNNFRSVQTVYTNQSMTLQIQEPPLVEPLYHTIPVNLYANKSIHLDGSDLPYHDVPTLRFYYNMGIDHMRMNWNHYLRPTPESSFFGNNVPSQNVYNSPGDNPPPPVYEHTSYMQTVQTIAPDRGSLALHSLRNSVHNTPPNFQEIESQCFRYEGPIQHFDVSSSTMNGNDSVPNAYPQVDYDSSYALALPYSNFPANEFTSPVLTPSSFITSDGVLYQPVNSRLDNNNY